jgi:hypothetical protein
MSSLVLLGTENLTPLNAEEVPGGGGSRNVTVPCLTTGQVEPSVTVPIYVALKQALKQVQGFVFQLFLYYVIMIHS